jgi:hypothetical protein
MTYACEWIRKALNNEDVGEQYPCEWVRKNWNSQIKSLPYPCEALEQYFSARPLMVKPSPDSELCYCVAKTSEFENAILTARIL